MKTVSKTQLSLLILALGVTLIPLAVTTGFLAYRSLTETSRFLGAPNLGEQGPSGIPTQGALYQTSGLWRGELLNPPAYPEVKNALWYRVVSERRPAQNQPWHRDTTAALMAERVSQFSLGPWAVEAGLLTKIALPMVQVYRDIDPFYRLSIEFKPLPDPNKPLTAIGYLKGRQLSDGFLERLVVFAPDDRDLVFDQITRKGYHKGFFLGGISLIFSGLSMVMILRVPSRQRP